MCQIFSFLGAATCNLIATVGPEGPEGSTIGEQQGQQLQVTDMQFPAVTISRFGHGHGFANFV
jgi:hypothetical protein